MTYKLTSLHQLMAYEFSQVEADFHSLTETQLNAVLTGGLKLQDLKDKLASGHQVLLKTVPSVPLLVQEKDDMGQPHWVINPAAPQSIAPTAQRAYLNRTAQGFSSGASAPSYSSSSARQAPLFNPETDYVPEPPEPDRSQEPPPLKYEYNFEVACSEDSLRTHVGCAFQLTGCEKEPVIGFWKESKTEHGTRYRDLTAFDRQKRLRAKIASASLGVSVPGPVTVRPIGSGIVREAFLPLVPAVRLGERLAFPTHGYFYHFHQRRLVQEYRILGDGKWSFYATRSTHDRLDITQGFNRYQTAILVYWKLGGKEVGGQYLLYRPQPITRAELDTLNEPWLKEHGVALDIPAILKTQQSAPLPRPSEPDPQDKRPAVADHHVVQLDPATRKREGWGEIAAQYGLSVRALLDLNPDYDRDPMTLAAGHTLTVRPYIPPQKVFVSGLPPQPPQTYHHPQNVWYPHSERYLPGTQLKTINTADMMAGDIVVVSLKSITEEVELPFTILHSQKRPYFNADSTPSEDMRYGDMTGEEIAGLTKEFALDYEKLNTAWSEEMLRLMPASEISQYHLMTRIPEKAAQEAWLFNRWQSLLTLASSGKLEQEALNILEMIKQKQPGQIYQSEALNQAAADHPAVKEFIESTLPALCFDALDDDSIGWDIPSWLSPEGSTLTNKIMQDYYKFPLFNHHADYYVSWR